jgi:hypothetical protein
VVTVAEIRPQSATHRTSGQRPATNGNEVPGPARIRNQVNSVLVQIEQLPQGALRVTTPTTQGWAAVARTQQELVAAIQAAFTEAQIAAYAQWRGHAYDLAELSSRDDPDPLVRRPPSRNTRRSVRKDQYDPADWKVRSDGMWESPRGTLYKPESTMVERVKAARTRLGLD